MFTMDLLLSGDSEAIRKEIINIDLDHLADKIDNIQYRNFFRAGPGREHFKLLSAISSLFSNQKIFEAETSMGLSSLALSTNPDVLVISYDNENSKILNKSPDNVEYNLGNLRTDRDLLSSPFILIDMNQHDGIQEHLLHTFLLESNYKGLVLWDNIFCNNIISEWWNNLPVKKHDITNAGHWSGTGLINYG